MHFQTSVKKSLHKFSRAQTEDMTVPVHFANGCPGLLGGDLNSPSLLQMIHFSQKAPEKVNPWNWINHSGRCGPIIKELIRLLQSSTSSGHSTSWIDTVTSMGWGPGPATGKGKRRTQRTQPQGQGPSPEVGKECCRRARPIWKCQTTHHCEKGGSGQRRNTLLSPRSSFFKMKSILILSRCDNSQFLLWDLIRGFPAATHSRPEVYLSQKLA